MLWGGFAAGETGVLTGICEGVARWARSYEARGRVLGALVRGEGSRAGRAPTAADGVRLAGFEGVGVQVVAGQELVEVSAISFCEAGSLAYVAHGDLENLR